VIASKSNSVEKETEENEENELVSEFPQSIKNEKPKEQDPIVSILPGIQSSSSQPKVFKLINYSFE
jgi:hypothetical protein